MFILLPDKYYRSVSTKIAMNKNYIKPLFFIAFNYVVTSGHCVTFWGGHVCDMYNMNGKMGIL